MFGYLQPLGGAFRDYSAECGLEYRRHGPVAAVYLYKHCGRSFLIPREHYIWRGVESRSSFVPAE